MAKKVFIIIYSMYGHMLKLAESVKKGLEAQGIEATIYQVEETLPEEGIYFFNFSIFSFSSFLIFYFSIFVFWFWILRFSIFFFKNLS